MRLRTGCGLLSMLVGWVALAAAVPPSPPRAERIPTRLEMHGHTRSDDYYWLRERDNPAVRAYLEAENAYVQAGLAHTAALQESLFAEMRDRVPETDTTVPYRLNGYTYYERYEPEAEYPLYCRRATAPGAAEEIMLKGADLAAGHAFLAVWVAGLVFLSAAGLVKGH